MAEDEINKLKEKNDDELKLIESNLEKSESKYEKEDSLDQLFFNWINYKDLFFWK